MSNFIEKIKRLLLEATAKNFGSRDTNEGDRIGGDVVTDDESPEVDEEKLKKMYDEHVISTLYDMLRAIKILRVGGDGKKRTPKIGDKDFGKKKFTAIRSYQGDADSRDWRPSLMKFSDPKIVDESGKPVPMYVTEQTYSFLQNIVDKFTEEKYVSKTESFVPVLKGVKFVASTFIDSGVASQKNELLGIERDILGLPSSAFSAMKPMFQILGEDPRFSPESYQIDITVPCEQYDIGTIKKIVSEFADSVRGTGEGLNTDDELLSVVEQLNENNIHMQIRIHRDVTTIPMYKNIWLGGRRNAGSRMSKYGALEKFLWSKKASREIANATTDDLLSGYERMILANKKAIDRFEKQKTSVTDKNAKKTIQDKIDSLTKQNDDLKTYRDSLPKFLSPTAKNTKLYNLDNEILSLTARLNMGTDEKTGEPLSDEAKAELRQTIDDLRDVYDNIQKYRPYTYVEDISRQEAEQNETLFMGPMALIAKAYQMATRAEKNDSSSFMYISNDNGASYLWMPYKEGSSMGYHYYILTKDKKLKALLDAFFQGFIPLASFRSKLMDLPDIDDEKKLVIDNFVTNKQDKIYCMKVMYADKVDVFNQMQLPDVNGTFSSMADKTNTGYISMPEGMSVPGSNSLPRTNTYLKMTLTDTGVVPVLTSESIDVTSFGSGSMSFLDPKKEFNVVDNAYRDWVNNFSDIITLYHVLKDVINGYYCIIGHDEFKDLKDGKPVVTVDASGNRVTLDPKDTFVESVLKTEHLIDGRQMMLKNDKSEYNKTSDDFETLIITVRQVLRQLSNLAKSVHLDMDEQTRQWMEESQSGINMSVSGRPTTVGRMERNAEDIVVGSLDYGTVLSDSIVAHRASIDLGPMIGTYLNHLITKLNVKEAEEESETVKKTPYMFSEIITTPTQNLNPAMAQKYLLDAARMRESYVTTVLKFLDDLDTGSFQQSIANEYRKYGSNDEMSVGIALKYFKVLFDTVNVTKKLTDFDGINQFQYGNFMIDKNAESIGSAIWSRIDTDISVPLLFSGMDEPDIPQEEKGSNALIRARDSAILSAPQEQLSVGFIFDPLVSKTPLLDPIEKRIKAAVAQIKETEKFSAIGFTPNVTKCKLPNRPYHTFVVLTKSRKGTVVLNIVSSMVSASENAKSPYIYKYDEDRKSIVTDSNPIPEDKEDILEDMCRKNMAYCMINALSTKMITEYTRDSIAKFKEICRKAFETIKNTIETNHYFDGEIGPLKMDGLDESDTNRFLSQLDELFAVKFGERSMKDYMSDIMKTILLMYVSLADE